MKTFIFNGLELEYFYHNYNETWKKERIIEIPIIQTYVEDYDNILEVGNVLSNYFKYNHDVVDKYDKSPNIIKEDIVYYKTNKKYDLIVSVSTIEHIGVEDTPPNPRRIFDAINNMKNLLSEDGIIVVTVPMGQNKFLDKYIYDKELLFDEYYGFKRISRERWIEVDWEDITESNYDHPYGNANELFVGVIYAQTK